MAVTQRARTIGVMSAAVVIAVAMIVFKGGGPEAPHWHPWDGPTISRDLEALDDTLRVLALRDPLVYEERQRLATGLEFELLQRFARKLKMKLKVIPFDHPDSLLAALWQGRGDIGAGQFVYDRERENYLKTTEAYASVQPVIVKQRPEVLEEDSLPTLGSAIDSFPRAIGSPFNTHNYDYFHTLQLPVAHPSSPTEDELLVSVVTGERSTAIISDLRAGHEAERFPLLEFSEAVGEPQQLRFITRASSPRSNDALNAWLTDKREVEARALIIRSYREEIPAPGPLHSRRAKGMRGDSISPFDDDFRQHAARSGYGWQLLAAMAWKETRFDSTVTSHKGAMGIMQFMPNTAERMGLDSTSSMGDHIEAAARYISRLDTLWYRAVPDRKERLRFVLASYNAGPGHVIDAQRLAEQLGLDPTRWEGHVERAVLLLAKPRYFLRPEMKNGYCKGSQVFHYVRGVLVVYDQLKARKAL